MHKLSIVVLILALFPLNHATPAAAANATCGFNNTVYVFAYSAEGQFVDKSCGIPNSAHHRIALPERWVFRAMDHDDEGRVYVLETSNSYGTYTGALLIYDGTWKVVSFPSGLVDGLSVDRRRGVAYVYRDISGDNKHSWISAVSANGRLRRSFVAGPITAGAQMRFDGVGQLVVLPADSDHFSIFDPLTGRQLRTAHAFGCAMTSGNDGLFYGENCYGVVATYQPPSFSIIRKRQYIGHPIVGVDLNEYPKIAVDSRHNIYVSDQAASRLLMYRPGVVAPLNETANIAVRDMTLDQRDNLYILVAPEDPRMTRRLAVYRKFTGLPSWSYAFPAGVYPKALTVVSPH